MEGKYRPVCSSRRRRWYTRANRVERSGQYCIAYSPERLARPDTHPHRTGHTRCYPPILESGLKGTSSMRCLPQMACMCRGCRPGNPSHRLRLAHDQEGNDMPPQEGPLDCQSKGHDR
eukprot:7376713-Prymnesium_polylepis.1